jgi:CRISPR/Cas system-associated exonuclease Cas4 (RecB family)
MTKPKYKKVQLLPPDEVKFIADSHTYWSKTGKELTSVSKVIEKYAPKFDPDGSILKNCAFKKGVSTEELQAEWTKTKDDAATRGTNFHSSAEHFIETGKILDNDDKDIVEKLAQIPFKGTLHAEQRLYSIEDGIAGTTDLIDLLPDNSLNLVDFKTNKKLEKYNIWGKRMNFPVTNLPATTFLKYELQLSIYAYMLEQHGYWVNSLTIFWINPKTRDIEIHKCHRRLKEVERILDHFKGKQVKNLEFDYDPFVIDEI